LAARILALATYPGSMCILLSFVTVGRSAARHRGARRSSQKRRNGPVAGRPGRHRPVAGTVPENAEGTGRTSMVGQAHRSALPAPRGQYHTTTSQAGLLARLHPSLPTFPCKKAQWRGAESSGLQQRGLRRNGQESMLPTSPNFPFHLPRRSGVGTRNGAESNRSFRSSANIPAAGAKMSGGFIPTSGLTRKGSGGILAPCAFCFFLNIS
jgi:hypothetical protein